MTVEEFQPQPGQIPQVSVNNDDKNRPLSNLSPRPQPDTPSVRNDAIRTKSKRTKIIHDKWWLWAFLAHTAAYLGASGWINYVAITNDKLAVIDDTLGPIDT